MHRRSRALPLALVTLAACSTPPVVNDAATDGVTDSATPPDTRDVSQPTDAADVPALPDVQNDVRVTCPSPVAPDPLATQRAACAFTTGATVHDTLGIDEATRTAIPIRHIVVLMKENRSFDELLGQLHDQGQPDAEAVPSGFSNRDLAGVSVAPFHRTTTCDPHDPGHQWAEMHAQVNDGAMDGFVTSAARTTGTDGHFAMGYQNATDLPFYYWLASTFAINDRHFASVRSGTFPNRNFMLLATADGITATGAGYPRAATPTIFRALDAAHITWGAYSNGALLGGTLNWHAGEPGTHTLDEFLVALDAGTLPQVAFVDGIENVEDEHPDANIQQGEAWTRNVYDHAVRSPLWPGLAVIWTYDEAGGFADHVPPPNRACVSSPSLTDQLFFELGQRVPFAVISPWARPHYVSHVVQEHTAVTRFIETVFGIPALTGRDANSPALLDLFDFACAPALMTPPIAPAAGTHGCFGSCVLTTDRPSYRPGDSIRVTFSGCPGNNPIDWIGVYPYAAGTPSFPHPGSTVWAYLGGTHTGSGSPAAGNVTLNGSLVGRGPWPLPVGSYTAFYLLNDGYRYVTSVEFTVTP